MNQKTRNRIQEIIDELEGIGNEEQEKYDNALENLQGSERYEKIQENAENIEEGIECLRVIVDF